MDPAPKIAGAFTPAKEKSVRSRLNESLRLSENANPNLSSPGLKSAKKSAIRNPNLSQVASPSAKKKIRERKFVIAKRKLRNDQPPTAAVEAATCEKCGKAIGRSRCLCTAYESLRASQEDFFKKKEGEICDELKVFDAVSERNDAKLEVSRGFEGEIGGCGGVLSEVNWEKKENVDEAELNSGDMGVKRSRDRLLEEARVPLEISGSGRVKNLVKEFEKLTVRRFGDAEEKKVEEEDKGAAESESGLQKPSNDLETRVSSSSFCPSDYYLTMESLGLDSRRSYSLDSAQGSISTVTSVGGRKFRRSSNESTGNRTRRRGTSKQPKATSQRPFMLRTEERGRCKEEEFTKKLRQKMEEEEKMRIPIAQGLPWTTDEPECLVKPPVKENTRPIDLVLHSDVRAVERSEFDQQVSVKMNFIEQYKMERERQQRLEEEEEIRRLRKELVPKAQPMPYFDRPFVPRRSEKHPTIPKEPKFHIPEHKKIKCYLSLDDLYTHQH
ncbi:TPX2 (targeting protein for Xklp2) protein family [Striga hermonthica]|uniref:TPX2 (Targeting protein for Xklp2) protein family n=1 Tax=Striga hermonthica TaxID=68872 RepID=A0A9N7N1I6_STRHE|nr:TPX2 (targeting protein for Xklp2) protein family [Striga hermonthica]